MDKNNRLGIGRCLGLVVIELAVIISGSVLLSNLFNNYISASIRGPVTELKVEKTKKYVCQEAKTLITDTEKDSVKLKETVEDMIVLNGNLKKNIRGYQESKTTQKESFKQRIQDELQQRKEKLTELIQRDPRSAVQEILTDKEHLVLNEISENCFEREVTLEGQLEIVSTDNFEKKTSTTEYYLKTNAGKKYTLRPVTQPKEYVESRTKVKIKGWALDNQIVFNSQNPVSSKKIDGGFDVISNPGNPPVYGEQRVVVLFVNFQDTTKPSITTTRISDLYKTKINPYYVENSFGNINIKADVFGWYNIPLNRSCIESGYQNVLTEAINVANADVNFLNYDRIVLIAPWQICSCSGLGTVGKNHINTPDGNITASVAWIGSSYATNPFVHSHELGHNFGLHHSNFYRCGNASLAQTGCTSVTYGDIYDVMGAYKSTPLHFNSAFKETSGWILPENIKNIDSSGIYSIKPIELAPTGFQALKLPISRYEYLYFEYRQPIGSDGLISSASNNIFNGPIIHLFSGTDANLIDPTPPESKSTISIPVGMTWTDPSTGTKIRTIEATTEQTTVDVTFGKTDFIPPEISNFSPEYEDGEGNIIPTVGTTTLSVNATDASGISKVEFYYYYAYAGVWKLIGTKTTAPYSLQFDTTKVPNGFNTIKVVAYDNSGISFGAWNNMEDYFSGIYVDNTDTTPPKITSLSPKVGTKVVTPVTAYAGASDNAAVMYVLFTSDTGKQVSDYVSSFSTLFDYSFGTHSFSAQAFDMTGNPSSVASVSFEVLPAIISVPYNGSYVIGTKTISVSVSKGVKLSKVEFYKDGEISPFATDTVSPYSTSWNSTTVSDGNHILLAKAYDTTGVILDVPAVNVIVDNNPPTVSFSNPVNGDVLTKGTYVYLTATAEDTVLLSYVKFIANGTTIGNDSTAPYSYKWKVGTSATYTLEAKAYDKAGNYKSSIINVTTQ